MNSKVDNNLYQKNNNLLNNDLVISENDLDNHENNLYFNYNVDGTNKIENKKINLTNNKTSIQDFGFSINGANSLDNKAPTIKKNIRLNKCLSSKMEENLVDTNNNFRGNFFNDDSANLNNLNYYCYNNKRNIDNEFDNKTDLNSEIKNNIQITTNPKINSNSYYTTDEFYNLKNKNKKNNTVKKDSKSISEKAGEITNYSYKQSSSSIKVDKILEEFKNSLLEKERIEQKYKLGTQKNSNYSNNNINYNISNNIDINTDNNNNNNNNNKIVTTTNSGTQTERKSDLDNLVTDLKKQNNVVAKEKKDLEKKYNSLKIKYENEKIKIDNLEKEISQQNYNISQMQQTLLTNNKHITFLNTLRDPKENEDLIKKLKDTISVLQNKNTNLNNLNISNIKDMEIIKNENESLKLYITERENTILSLKNSVSFLTQTLKKEKISTEKEYQIIIDNLQKKIDSQENQINSLNTEKKNILNQIDEYSKKYEKIKNEYESLYQKYVDQNKMMENIKNSFIDIEEMQKKNLAKNQPNNISNPKKLSYSQHDLKYSEKKNKNNRNKSVKNKTFSMIVDDINLIKKHVSPSSERCSRNLLKGDSGNYEKKRKSYNYYYLKRNKKEKHKNSMRMKNLISVDLNDDIKLINDNIKEKANNENKKYQKVNDKKDISIKKIQNNNDMKISSSSQNFNELIFSEESIEKYSNIYSLSGKNIISFNLKEKKFKIITPNDNTNKIFTNILNDITNSNNNENSNENIKEKIFPITVNSSIGFFILLNKYVFYYEQRTNNINILTKLFSNHNNGGFILVNNDLYALSGVNNLQCEKYSLSKNNKSNLPNINFQRINSGLVNINNEYLYFLFGKYCDNSIEKLSLENQEKWEVINTTLIEKQNFCLNKFVAFLDDFNNVIILGGDNYINGEYNHNIYGFNLTNNVLEVVGKIDTVALYFSQYIVLDGKLFVIYDSNNGLHFFNKDLDFHEIYNNYK